ncbi:deoxyribose-phosphate aldolase [bacterium]|nr:deoxyribose-phosphate aldolase [bacterium]
MLPENLNPGQLAATIDHTLLKAEATPEAIEQLCKEAIDYSFATVCINPLFVPQAKELLKGYLPKVCTVIGFPLGASSSIVKAAEAEQAIEDGAKEIDMVLAVGLLKARHNDEVEADIRRTVAVCKSGKVHLKVIIEAAMLTLEEKVVACRLAAAAGADFVKTSTGFGPGGATIADVRLMKTTVADHGLKVKAAGGIRSLEDALAMLEAGADRLGTSAGLKIMTEARSA